MIYYDSSALVKIYHFEQGTEAVIKHISQHKSPVTISHLSKSEIFNAIRLKLHRKEISVKAHNSLIRSVNDDTNNGLLILKNCHDWPSVFTMAEAISSAHTATTGLRTLDTLHIAIAAQWTCETFVTFDKKQATVAMTYMDTLLLNYIS